MKHILFSLACITCGYILYGQTNYQSLSGKFCTMIQEINTDDSLAQKKFETAARNLARRHEAELKGLTNQLVRKNPTLPRSEVQQQVVLKVILNSIESCPVYVTMSRAFLSAPPPFNRAFEYIVTQTEAWIASNRPTGDMLMDQIPVLLVDYALEKRDEIPAHYKDGPFGGDFSNDAKQYLLHHSDLFYRELLKNATINAYGGLKLID